MIEPCADVFVLGCRLYGRITGEPAFTGDHVLAVLAKIVFEQPPSSLSPETGSAMDARSVTA